MTNENRLIYANEAYEIARASGRHSDFARSRADLTSLEEVLEECTTVDAVEVPRLGELGRLMMPYKGCPRGRMGARGVYVGEEIQTEFEVMALDAIEDIEGDRWVPVLAEDLNNLKARLNNAVKVVHGRWIVKGQEVFCSHCDKESGYNHWGASAFSDYCPNCGAKMDGGNENGC